MIKEKDFDDYDQSLLYGYDDDDTPIDYGFSHDEDEEE
jgi:hypothetical protein